MEKGQKKLRIEIILILFPILIVIGKIIRWTILKGVLVDAGIGHHFLSSIEYGNCIFTILGEDTDVNPGGNVVYLFSKINKLFALNTYIDYEIFISIVWNTIVVCILISNTKKTYNIFDFIFLILSIIVLNIFDFCLAKEPVQMLFFIGIYLILKSKKLSGRKKELGSYGILVLSIFIFRKYYILVLIFTIFIKVIINFFILKKDKVTIWNILKIIVSIGLFYFLFLNVAKIISVENYKEIIRVRLRISEAASDMRSLFMSDNLVIFVLDYIIMIFRMLIPIELLKLGIKYIPYVIYQFFISAYIFKKLRDIRNNTDIQNITLFLFIGFILASATFEPDFGSWVRHETVMFPIIIIMNGIYRIKD